MKFQDLARKEIRYLLFRIKESVVDVKLFSREKSLPVRRVIEREEELAPFKKGEAKKILEGWGYSGKGADRLVSDLRKHMEEQEFFTGWKHFAEPSGIFQAWDVGIEEDDVVTKAARPEKAWLFGKSRFEVQLRGLRVDGETALEKETGRKAEDQFETEIA